jgi:hypothetical protein
MFIFREEITITSPIRFVRDDILKLTPYMPSKESCNIKLDANESPYDVPKEIKERIWNRIKNEHFNYYYDPSCDELRENLSRYTGANPDQIFVGSGGDEIINDIIMAFAGPDKLEKRKVIDIAKGILMDKYEMKEREAYRRIQRLSMEKRLDMIEIAKSIILSNEFASL